MFSKWGYTKQKIYREKATMEDRDRFKYINKQMKT